MIVVKVSKSRGRWFSGILQGRSKQFWNIRRMFWKDFKMSMDETMMVAAKCCKWILVSSAYVISATQNKGMRKRIGMSEENGHHVSLFILWQIKRAIRVWPITLQLQTKSELVTVQSIHEKIKCWLENQPSNLWHAINHWLTNTNLPHVL
jgi:hypothetical protein